MRTSILLCVDVTGVLYIWCRYYCDVLYFIHFLKNKGKNSLSTDGRLVAYLSCSAHQKKHQLVNRDSIYTQWNCWPWVCRFFATSPRLCNLEWGGSVAIQMTPRLTSVIFASNVEKRQKHLPTVRQQRRTARKYSVTVSVSVKKKTC